jgi:hypothetical protein
MLLRFIFVTAAKGLNMSLKRGRTEICGGILWGYIEMHNENIPGITACCSFRAMPI